MIAQRKPQTPITISTTVGDDHRLIIDIPLPQPRSSDTREMEDFFHLSTRVRNALRFGVET